MILSRIFLLYLSRNFLWSLFFTTLVIATCILFANFFDVLNRLRTTIVPFHLLITLALLKLPYLLNELLPLVTLIASLFFFEKLSRNHELVVMFSGGISVWKLIQPILLISVTVCILALMFLQPIASFCLAKQENLENIVMHHKSQNTVSISGSGLYIAENIDGQNRIYIAKTITPHIYSLHTVTILILDEENEFVRRLDGAEAILKNGEIEFLSGGLETDKKWQSSSFSYLKLPTNLDISWIVKKFTSPENISFWKLESLYTQLEKSGIKADKFISYYYKLLFRPIYSLAVIFIAACFIQLNPRGKKGISTLGVGGIIGLLIHGGKEIMTAFLLANNFSYSNAQIIPGIIIIIISIMIIINKFET